MNSKVIQVNNTYHNNQDTLISILANLQGVTAKEQILILLAINNIHQNNPFQITKQAKTEIGEYIIQIIKADGFQKSSLSVGIHRLKAKGVLIEFNGMVKLCSVYDGMDKVEQIVIRVKK